MGDSKTIYKVGYRYINSQGLTAEVIEYNGRKNIKVQLEDGYIGNTTSTVIKQKLGPVSPMLGKTKVGDLIPTKDGDCIKILKYTDALNLEVMWLSDGYTKTITNQTIIGGVLKHPLKNIISIGDVFKTKTSGDVVVLEVISSNKIWVKFKDNTVKVATAANLRKGNVSIPNRRYKVAVGDNIISNSGWSCKVIEYKNAHKVLVEWQDGSRSTETSGNLSKGSVLCLNQPTFCGVGYWGYGDYLPGNFTLLDGKKHADKRIQGYWSRMITRCYNELEQQKPSCSAYVGCTVSDSWHNFQEFHKWADSKEQSRYFDEDGKIWSLDKDLLFKGNRIYSEKNCTFLPPEVNSFLSDPPQGGFPRGVHEIKPKEKTYKVGYVARCHRYGNRDYLGFFNTPMEAFEVYKVVKEEYAKVLANKWQHKLEPLAYDRLYEYTVEPYD